MYHIFVIADKLTVGACLGRTLRNHGYAARIVGTMRRFGDEVSRRVHPKVDLVIVTNTTLTPEQIDVCVPDIRVRLPEAPIMVLSGYFQPIFASRLREKGMDVFLPLPFVESTLLSEIALLLNK